MIYKLEATVVEQEGNCIAGYKVGDKIDLNDFKAPSICRPLLNALNAQAMVLKYEGDMPWLKDKEAIRITGSEPENLVVREIKRIKEV